MKSNTTRIPICLIYSRVSSFEQAREGVSLDAQVAACRRYAAGQGWLLGREFQDVLSGGRDDRPEYQALLAEVRRLRAAGQPVVVVVMRLDRLGRRLLERVRCREELKVLGVPVHSVLEGGEVSDLLANILASIAEEEVRALGERVAVAMRHIATSGWFPPGRPSWGYRLRPATAVERKDGAPVSVLEFDPITMPWARDAFNQAARGETLHAVHRWVLGLPNEARGDRVMTYQGVRRILAAPVYVARHPHGDPDVLARPVGKWPALVDDETWRRVRERVESHQRLPRQASGLYLLTGLLRCPVCGARMHGRHRADRGRRYQCAARTLGTNAENRSCLTEVMGMSLDAAVLAAVLPVVDAATSTLPELRSAVALAWESLRRTGEDGADLTGRRLMHLQREADLARSRLTKAAVLFADDDLDKTGYELLRDRVLVDLEAAEAELDRMRGTRPHPILPPLEEVLREAGSWVSIFRQGDLSAQRDVLGVLVERVVPVRVRRGEYAAEIAWTPLGKALRELPAAAIPVAA